MLNILNANRLRRTTMNAGVSIVLCGTQENKRQSGEPCKLHGSWVVVQQCTIGQLGAGIGSFHPIIGSFHPIGL
jgi:hypothetical protein